MELLGNKNKSENLLIKLQETNRKVLTASSLSEEELKDILCLLDAFSVIKYDLRTEDSPPGQPYDGTETKADSARLPIFCHGAFCT